MDKMVITGGRPLKGTVRISGAKNAALPIFAATLLAPGTHEIGNVPRLQDITTFRNLLIRLGLEIDIQGDTAYVTSDGLADHQAPYDLVRKMRASVLVLGPMLGRWGKAAVSLPGGCAIGVRPIDQHLKGLQALGAQITLKHGYVHAKARALKGAEFGFDLPTVTGTENLMMAATLAQGRTVLHNAAREPEVCELADVLNGMGARIQGAGASVITIDGVSVLKPMQHRIMADRIETGTFIVAAAITGGDVEVHGCPPVFLDAFIRKIEESGAEVITDDAKIRVISNGRPKAVDFTTLPYPGFPTDMQAQLMANLCLAKGTSVITETVFENRFMHVPELRRMGAQIQIQSPSAIVKGVKKLTGAQVMATDLRASASLVLAGLAAEGRTEVLRVYHLDRGYDHIEEKLSKLGAEIQRVEQ